jgi:hypothetical protein
MESAGGSIGSGRRRCSRAVGICAALTLGLLALSVGPGAGVSAAVSTSPRAIGPAPLAGKLGAHAHHGAQVARRATQPFRFAAPRKSTTGNDPVISLEDVTGDGHLDLVTCGQHGVGVKPGAANGSFGTLVGYLKGQAMRDVHWKDVDGDGIADMVAASADRVLVLPGLAGGGYGIAVASQTSTETTSFGVGDISGDGKADIVEGFSDGREHALSIQLGAGDGTFGAPKPLATPYEASGPHLVDLDGDGHLDLVLYVNEFEEKYGAGVLLGDGKGGFGAMETYTVGRDLEPADIEVGDMNGDGIPDLVLDMALEGDTDLGILLGRGDGTFRQAKKTAVWSFMPKSYEDEFYSIALGDFDGDGKTDVAAARRRALMVVRCDGGGGFLKAQSVTLKDLKYPDVFAGDLNGDGRPDLVSAYGGAANVRLNTTR